MTTSYLQHPLERNDGTFIERRLSISSDLSDEEEYKGKRTRFLSHNNWNGLLSQFDSQPDMMKLIQLCKQEEDRRCKEESNMKMKEYQVYRQLQHIQQQQQQFQLQLPPLHHKK